MKRGKSTSSEGTRTFFSTFSDKFFAADIKSVLFAVLIAVGLLLLTFALKYVVEDVVIAGGRQDTQIYTWSFSYANDEKGIENVSEWGTATELKPLDTAKKATFYRLQRSFEKSDVDRLLTITCEYAPMKITLDGEEIYNNHYGESSFVGNKYNSVIIPSSTRAQVLDIYMTLPFSASFTASLSNYDAASGSLGLIVFGGAIIGGAVAIAGLLLVIISVLISIKNRNLSKMLMLGFAVIVCGANILFRQISINSYMLNDPVWYNLILFLNILTAFMVMLNIVLCFGCWSVPINTGLVLFFMGAVVTLFISEAFWIIFSAIAALLLGILTSFFIAKKYIKLIMQRVQYAQPVFALLLYIAMLNVCKGAMLMAGNSEYFVFFEIISLLVFSIILFVVYFKQSIFVSVGLVEREQQVRLDSAWIDKIASIIAGVFTQKTENSFFTEAAKGFCNLIETSSGVYEVHETKKNHSKIETEQRKVAVCVALKKNGEFEEIYNEGMTDVCRYDLLASRFVVGKTKNISFASTYFDVFFVQNNEIHAIMHFENISDGLSVHFENIINTAYANMAIAFANLSLKTDMVITQENVFVALAETVEMKSGCTKEHLKTVSKITKAICEQLGFSEYETRIVSSAAMVHDIGKIAIPESIINKTGKLTLEEREIIKQHTEYGYTILSRTPGEFMNAAALIARDHHERFDGTGYNRMKGEDISLYARIVSVADVFDALVSVRSYKDAWSDEKAVKYINDNAGTEFDPAVVAAFNECLQKIKHINEHKKEA